MALYIIALIALFIVVALGVKTQMDNARKQKLDAIAFRQKLIDAQLEILKKEKELIDKRYNDKYIVGDVRDNEQKILNDNEQKILNDNEQKILDANNEQKI